MGWQIYELRCSCCDRNFLTKKEEDRICVFCWLKVKEAREMAEAFSAVGEYQDDAEKQGKRAEEGMGEAGA